MIAEIINFVLLVTNLVGLITTAVATAPAGAVAARPTVQLAPVDLAVPVPTEPEPITLTRP